LMLVNTALTIQALEGAMADRGKAALGGCLGGLVAGACAGMIAVLGAALAGMDWYFPLELAGGLATASTARFDPGLQPGVAVVGALVHFSIAAGWGALFGVAASYLLDGLTSKEGIWIGAFFGIFVWVIDFSILIPKVDPAAAHAIPLWFGALIHLSYGSVVGLTYPRFRRSRRLDPTRARAASRA
jgi:hypothetical protein